MAPCPRRKRGDHELLGIVPESSDNDITLWCARCGAMRRTHASGALVVGGSKDALTADEIATLFRADA